MSPAGLKEWFQTHCYTDDPGWKSVEHKQTKEHECEKGMYGKVGRGVA